METCPTTSFGIVHTKRTTAADKCFSSERAEVKISSLQRDKNKETYMPEFPFFPHLLSGARSSDWETFPLVNQLWSPTLMVIGGYFPTLTAVSISQPVCTELIVIWMQTL